MPFLGRVMRVMLQSIFLLPFHAWVCLFSVFCMFLDLWALVLTLFWPHHRCPSYYARGKKRRTDDWWASGHHGQPVVDAKDRGKHVTTSLFVFPHHVAEINRAFL